MSLTDSTLTSKVILISTGALYPNAIFSYPFKILNDTNLEVYDAGTLVTLTTDYTVTGVGDDNGGTVVFESGSEPAASAEVILRRIMTLDQQTDIPSAPAKFPEEAVEEALDKLTMIDQQQDEKASRALTYVETVNTDVVSSALASPADNAGKVLIASATGVTYAEYSAADYVSPLTTEGDLIGYTSLPTRLAVGTTGNVLQVDTAVSGKVKWGIGHTTQGDLITHDGSDTARLALGASNACVSSDGTDLVWKVMPWAQGQCRLTYTSTTVLTLIPYNGNGLVLKTGSVWGTHTLGSAGITLGISGLSAATLYYVYVYNNAGTLTLEGSTTAYEVETTNGYAVKIGDATRLLVGLVYMNAGPLFADSVTLRYTRSWYNDRGVYGEASYTADASTASATLVELHTEIRLKAVIWSGETVNVHSFGSVETPQSTIVTFGPSTDGTTYNHQRAVQFEDIATASGASTQIMSYFLTLPGTLTEGLVTFYQLAKTASGTITAYGTAADGRVWQTLVTTGRK